MLTKAEQITRLIEQLRLVEVRQAAAVEAAFRAGFHWDRECSNADQAWAAYQAQLETK